MNRLSAWLSGEAHRAGDLARRKPASGDTWVVWFDRAHQVAAALGALLVIINLASGSVPVQLRLAGAGVALVLAWWCWWCLFHHRPRFFTRRWAPVVFVLVALPLYVTLGVLGSSYQFLLFLAYWQVFSLLPLARSILVATVLTFVNAWANQGFAWQMPMDAPEEWALFLGAVFLSGVLAAFITAIIRQSDARQALVEELHATRAHLAESERTAGVMEERHRLAGEVHDTIAQDITSVVMHLEAAEAHLPEGSSSAPFVAMAKQSARSGLAEARRIIHALRPDILEGAPIDRALETVVDRWRRESGIEARFTTTGEPLPLGREAEVAVLRALQEALANVRKHASAARVDVTLSYLGDEVILDVRDNGRGMVNSTAGAGMGLLTMRERVAGLGGHLDVESAPDEGTTVVVSIHVWNEERVEA